MKNTQLNCVGNVQCLNIKYDGVYCYHWTLKG